MMGLRQLPFLLLAMVLAHSATAQQMPPALDLNLLIASKIGPGVRLARFIEAMRGVLLQFDFDRDGAITSVDRERIRQVTVAASRPAFVTHLLRADFNGDGVVTQDEWLRYATYVARISLRGDGPEIEASRQQQVSTMVDVFMRADQNGDGRIDWPEMVGYGKLAAESSSAQSVYDLIYRDLLGLDADGDGRTTLDEFTAAMDKRFAEVDTDGNGVISRGEFEAYWQRIGRPAPKVADLPPSPVEELADACAVPRPSGDARIVLFNVYGGEGLSSVALGSQDAVTKATRVTIEPGDEPLYLVLVARTRIVWQFEGAVGRVKRAVLVAMAGPTGAATPVGATGLPRDVITFGNSGNCITLWRSMSRAYSDPLLRNSLLLWGRQPDAVSDLETAWNLRLPSGQVSAPTEAEQRPTFPIDNPTAIHLNHVRRELLTYSRGGVVPIDPAPVVAEQPVARYEVLPEEAGLLQLMLEGALERNQQGEFLIRKAMRFPAGLAAWHAVSFRLPKDIPVPTGDPLRSKVWSEDAGAFLCLSDHCKQPQR